MQKISFIKKLITCLLAGLIIGASALRIGVTYFRTWANPASFSIIPLLTTVVAVVYAFIWQARKTNNPSTLAFWQGLIRYGVAFDLAEFGWAKIFHLQLVMPLSKLDLPYNSFSPSDLFWTFFSHSYLFGCIIAGMQITGSMLLLFYRTRFLGVFILLPVLANILLMDIFYQIGNSVVVHASIMMAGIVYFLVIEFDRLKAFFFTATNQFPSLLFSKAVKWVIRLSIIYIPLLLIALHGPVDKNPALTGKYQVKQFKGIGADSTLTVVYFDIKNTCVFQFGTPANRWNGHFEEDGNHLQIRWSSPTEKPDFNGTMSAANDAGKLILTGMLGKDSMEVILQKLNK